MKDVNTMSVDECRNEIAQSLGWYQCLYEGKSDASLLWQTATISPLLPEGKHPIPATLDEAAKLPDGHFIVINQLLPGHNDDGTMWCIHERGERGKRGCEAWGTTELEARFRLRVAVERAVRGEV